MVPPTGKLKSELILDELRIRQQSKETIDIDEKSIKIVVFTCGVHLYAFYGRDIREFLPGVEIYWVPGLPRYLPGLINVRGDIETIVDLQQLMGEECTPRPHFLTALAVLADFRSGIMIDSIEDVIDIPQSSINPPIATITGSAKDLVTGSLEYNGTTVSLLDIGKLATMISL